MTRIIHCPENPGRFTLPEADTGNLSSVAFVEELFLGYSQASDLLTIKSQKNFLRDGQLIASEAQSIIQSFDLLGRLTSRTLPFLNRRSEYDYNEASELVGKREMNTHTQAVRTTLYTYTAQGELSSLTDNGSTTLFERDHSGRITKITYPEGITQQRSYNAFSELSSQVWKTPDNTTLHEIHYEYNANGKISKVTTPEGETQHFYDQQSRLIRTIHQNGNEETFLFNPAGYLSEKTDNSRRLVITSNESGQVVEVLEYIPPTSPTHTTRQVWDWHADGLLRSIQNTTTGTATYYLWNAKKKLEGVVFTTTPDNSTAYAYLPGSDLRLSSVDRLGASTLFHWDGVQLREVLNPAQGAGATSPPQAQGGRAANLPTDESPAQTISSAFITGQPNTWDEVLTISLPTQTSETGLESLLLFLQNHQSSVMGTLETSNPLLSKKLFTYLAYGEPQGTNPESLPLAGIGYTGRQHDDTGLIYYRGRYRDSCTGSFIQEDPKRDGLNWYSYVNGDPVNYVDPQGYFSSGLNIGLFSHGGATEQQAAQRFKSWAQGLQPVNPGLGQSSMSPAQRLEFAAGFVPIANDLQDFHVLVTGQTPVSKEPVSWFERGIAGACLAIGGSYSAYHHWSKGKTAAANTDQLISVYHGSYNNYTEIMKNGLNLERLPAYVTRDRDAARNAVYGRYDPPTDSGIVESKIPQSDFEKFFKKYERTYPGFQGANLQSSEILLGSEELISIFNNGIQK